MEMPEGWKRVLKEYECLKSYHETRQTDMPFVLDLLREMAETLDKLHDKTYGATDCSGSTWTGGYDSPELSEAKEQARSVLFKFMDWK